MDGGLVGVTFIPAWETAELVLERMEGDGVMFRGSILNPEFSGSEQFSIFLKKCKVIIFLCRKGIVAHFLTHQ